MHDVEQTPDLGQDPERVPTRKRRRERLRAPVPMTPEGIGAWAREVCALLSLIRPLVEDATAPRGERVRSRKFLRTMLCRRLREVETRVRAVLPDAPECDP